MPWQEDTRMSLRKEFVHLALQQHLPLAELCRRFGISRKTGYKWLHRARHHVEESFCDRSRRPHSSPFQTRCAIEEQVINIRQRHPAWGGRKIAHVLKRQGLTDVPAPSTITHILRRHGLLVERESGQGRPYQRFEHEAPNQLWQMDFKGHFDTAAGRCDPLTIIDDHSRYNLSLQALQGQSTQPTKQALTTVFRRYGLPQRMNMDNGQPWGSPRATDHGLSRFTAWLIRLGIRVTFSRPAHPQTNGKDERFHRTLKAEVLSNRYFNSLSQVQYRFDQWRDIYNHERPHEGIDMAVPADRYTPSTHAFPEQLPSIEYGPDDHLRKVQYHGRISFKGYWLLASKGLRGQHVALRPKPQHDGVYEMFYCHHCFRTINLRDFEKGR